MKVLLASLLFISFNLSAGEKSNEQIEWSDAESGRHYLLASKKMSWYEAHRACTQQDMALLSLEALSTSEIKALEQKLQDETGLDWITSEGESRSKAKLWTSRGNKIYWKKRYKLETQRISAFNRAWVVRKNHSSNRKLNPFTEFSGSSATLNTLCMSYEDSWFGCELDFVCLDGEHSKKIDKIKFIEFGETEKDAIQNIVSRSESGVYTASNCSLMMDSLQCQRYSF